MSEHVISAKTYTLAFLALLVLLALSIWTGTLELGAWSLPVALGIGVAKAMIVVMFFMHLAYSTALVRLTAVAALLWMAIMLSLTFADYRTRGWRSDETPYYMPPMIDRTEAEERPE